MLLRFVAVLLCICTLAMGAGAQTERVTVDRNLRLFTTLAALNVAGFDVELGTQYHPVRAAVRRIADDLDPNLVQRLRQFYQTRKGNQPDESQLAQYMSLAVVLTDPPDLRPAFREELLPPDARGVLGFADLLREFYEKAGISRRWAEFRDQYEAEMDRLAPDIRDLLVLTDSYIRVPLGGPESRNMQIYVELTAPLNSVNVRSNQDSYYVILGGSTSSRMDDVRHAYLHFHLDNLVATTVTRIENPGRLTTLAANQTGVRPEYTNDFALMATESLIRAIELRMDRVAAAGAQQSINGSYRSGLLLAPYFYEALLAYEMGDVGIREEFPRIAAGIDIDRERERFQQTFHALPIPEQQTARAEVPVVPPPDPVHELLKTAEGAFNAGDNDEAEAAFEAVLEQHDTENGAALYGLGLIASREEDSDRARAYFDRAVKSDSADAAMKVWAYIFMGRIADLECDRSAAVAHYRAALELGDNTRNAQAAAQSGVQMAWGDGCR